MIADATSQVRGPLRYRLEVLMRGDVQVVAFENLQLAVVKFIEECNPKIEVLFSHSQPDEDNDT